jgi:hypothetical protein
MMMDKKLKPTVVEKLEGQNIDLGKIDLPEIPKPSVVKETDDQIIARIEKQNKEAAERLRNKKNKDPDEPEGFYQGGQAQIEPDLSGIGHGSDALMARNMIINSRITSKRLLQV